MKQNFIKHILRILPAVIFFSIGVFAQNAVGQQQQLKGEWNLTGLKQNGSSIDINAVKSRGGEKLGISFTDGKRFGLISTCNGMGADYSADDKGNFKPGSIISTKMFCGDDAMKVENALANAMQAVTNYEITNNELILRDRSRKNVLTFSPAKTVAPETEEITLYIDSKQSNCMTTAQMKCLRVKEKVDGGWRLFYDRIKGFEFQKGNYYILKVKRTKIENSPKDTSGFRWELIEILKKSRRFEKA